MITVTILVKIRVLFVPSFSYLCFLVDFFQKDPRKISDNEHHIEFIKILKFRGAVMGPSLMFEWILFPLL